MAVDIEEIKKQIVSEIRWLDRKPYSHNIITFALRAVASDHGTEAANKIIDELNLERYGYYKEQVQP